ncbi:Mediator of replication checkpoint protein 1 [Ceratocystis platani]|uniref:Mediator of replication checkpoint protein 1 n=1 Tax=Ceratocystis fimbriata f. sp. platani TaxID=88771 RepID=A0A0F8DJQ2_CERFI|nr:Mediator of replication checkpoint protein 1 [Ceratocystis platani]
MASRSPSPARSSPAPIYRGLTGRSRLNALLAGHDSGSEHEDSDLESAKPTRKTTRTTAVSPLDSSSESEDEIVRPRGRFAAQMMAQATAVASGDDGSDDDVGLTAREKLRRQLLKPSMEEKIPEKTPDKSGDDDSDASNNVPTIKRRLKPRASTPDANLVSTEMVDDNDDEDDDPAADEEAVAAMAKNPRLQALLERKRKERLAREAEEAAQRSARQANIESDDDDVDGDVAMDDINDDFQDSIGNATKQPPKERASKQARQASKKAMEDIHRETQRIQRNMQLAHEVKTRKKFDKKNLFAMFDFKPAGDEDEDEKEEEEEVRKTYDESREKQDVNKGEAAVATSPSKTTSSAAPAAPDINRANENAITIPNAASDCSTKKPTRQVKIPDLKLESITLDDAEIEIVDYSNDRVSKIAVPIEKMEPGMATLLQFAGKDEGHHVRLMKEKAEADLRRKARLQAKREHEARINLLKSKGIHVPTEEEREREAEQVEDILARAHEENERIRKRERERAKKNGEVMDQDRLLDDDSGDESFYGSSGDEEEEEEEEGAALELSGSEDEEEGEEEEGGEEEDEEAKATEGLVVENDDDDDEQIIIASRRPKKKNAQVLSDDEDEDKGASVASVTSDDPNKAMQTPRPKAGLAFRASTGNQSPAVPTSVLRSATKPFIPGLPVTSPTKLDLAEMFAGTLNGSQDPDAVIPTFDGASMPDFTQDAFKMLADSQPDIIMASQEPDSQLNSQGMSRKGQTEDESQGVETQGLVNNFSLRFSQAGDSFSTLDEQDSTLSQLSNMQMTQDQGLDFVEPLKERFVTAEPPRRDESIVPESPVPEKKAKSRLRSKEEALAAQGSARESPPIPASHETGVEAAEDAVDEFGFGTRSAADVLKEAARKQKKAEKKAKKLAEAFDRKKSKANEMVDDQAEESDDEYAGLGGVDGDFSSDDDSDAASVKEIIDDETKASTADERKLAAFYNERERVAEEAQVQKLYKDITTGGLRRKRGTNYDLSDSESDGERRRRMKRRQFDKMQRELLANERLRKTAEAPGNEAYMRAIVDEYAPDENSIIEMDMPDLGPAENDVSQEAPTPGPGTLPLRKAKSRKQRKPQTLQDVRSQLTELLDDPYERAAVLRDKLSDDVADNGDDDAIEVAGTPSSSIDTSAIAGAPPLRRAGSQVIDRLSLKRSASTHSTGSATSANGRMAFTAPGASQSRTRSLLRGATSSLISSGMANAAAGPSGGTTGGGVGDAPPMRKGAVKGSGLSGFSRENERRAALAETEKKREAKKLKGAEKRAQAIGGLFGAGSWE